ncbi:MAG: SRPBCC domain-containing protein, partial [Pseudomonadales bacterium]
MEIQCSYRIGHPPARVYAAWVSSATVIAPATAMDIDPRPGGHYRLLMEMPDFTGRN